MTHAAVPHTSAITPETVVTATLPRIAVVLPCYRVKAHILDVLASIPPVVEIIIVVDDACPERSGAMVETECTDPRVRVHYNAVNQGVGGAVLNGYREAIAAGADIIVKIDGDGQMDPRLIGHFVAPIAAGEADYTKGNRFFDLTNITRMPPLRIFGNAVLSFMAKLSTGYWDLFDPTNGYTAIHADVARRLPFDRISKRYFFETDLLFRLNTLRAVAVDVPMDAHYGDEVSNLRISRILGEFLAKHVRNFGKRIFYNYFLRDLSLASLELVAGTLLIAGGALFGAQAWLQSMQSGVSTPAGTVMLSALPIILGLQFVLAFLGYDIASVPRRPLHRANRGMAMLPARSPDQGA
ncbi:glycosyltransferase family 2 protein [Luteimonas sp. MC1782]|uniref:glycosyltransferase family 2 protein n=1 Tax=Luteimonas sp. MC1782 TaxID=2760305 RepID=UPI0016038FC9|nr:glycosyltransferase family 2 protein [Luteimonas sp. MC1782]MBB1472870.1 glycosyltransferase family 2 protein [Luteimonas sp. MC1782]